MTDGTFVDTGAVAAFLRRRRERLRPAEVELVAGQRGRTPGLRREEVALLAGVSTECYTRLEQVRATRASRKALLGIAEALRLEPSQRRHLLELSRHHTAASPVPDGGEQVVGAPLQHLLDELVETPAYILGRRWDILAWNPAAEILLGDLGALSPIERNCLHMMFWRPVMQSLHDWERHAKGLLGGFRELQGRVQGAPLFLELINAMHDTSDAFAEWWEDYEIKPWSDGTKSFAHPALGPLTFEHSALDAADEGDAGLRFITYVPAKGTPTRKAIRRARSHSNR